MEDNDDADEPLAEEPQLEDQPAGRVGYQTCMVLFSNKEIVFFAAEIEEILEEEQQQQVVAEVERIEPAAAPVNFMLVSYSKESSLFGSCESDSDATFFDDSELDGLF